MKQIYRFCIVGCLNFGISYSFFFLAYQYVSFSTTIQTFFPDSATSLFSGLQRIGIPSIDAATANVIGFGAGMVNSFLWNKLWTFQMPENTEKQIRKFIITNLICLLVSTISILIFTDINHWPYHIVWIVTMSFVTILNFVMSKYWVFS